MIVEYIISTYVYFDERSEFIGLVPSLRTLDLYICIRYSIFLFQNSNF